MKLCAFLFKVSAPSPQQNIPTAGIHNLSISDDQTPLISAPSPMNAAQAQNPSPPGFLSGIPLVNPASFTPGSNMPQEQAAPQIASQQQPMFQAHSVVSNMASYSSSK